MVALRISRKKMETNTVSRWSMALKGRKRVPSRRKSGDISKQTNYLHLESMLRMDGWIPPVVRLNGVVVISHRLKYIFPQVDFQDYTLKIINLEIMLMTTVIRHPRYGFLSRWCHHSIYIYILILSLKKYTSKGISYSCDIKIGNESNHN